MILFSGYAVVLLIEFDLKINQNRLYTFRPCMYVQLTIVFFIFNFGTKKTIKQPTVTNIVVYEYVHIAIELHCCSAKSKETKEKSIEPNRK